jgi:peptidoglycan/LPS O-acetylase OafA/YrhL
VTVALALASWAWRVWLLEGGAPFERLRAMPDVRADAFLLGAAAALVLAHRRPRLPRWALVAAGVALLWQLTVPPADEWTIALGWTLVPAATAVLAIGIVTDPGRWTATLASRPLLWVGAVSYSLYLWHFPLYRVLDLEWELQGWARTVVLVAASLVLAAASHRVIEQPTARLLDAARARSR